jgi:hypothetical protein
MKQHPTDGREGFLPAILSSQLVDVVTPVVSCHLELLLLPLKISHIILSWIKMNY